MKAQLRTLSRWLRAPLHKRQAERLIREIHAESPDLARLISRGAHLGSHGFYRVSTLQIPSEILALSKLVEDLHPRVIVEIGTSRGGTALIWAHLASECVITCDLNGSPRFSSFLESFPPPASTCHVVALVGDSHSPSFATHVKQELAGRPIDFLFIDGDHTEQGVEQEHKTYGPWVRPGGVIAFHDIVERQPRESNQVQHYWRRIRAQHSTLEFVENRDQTGFGIGVIRVPPA
jgi:cephalosporin hydroxylase